MLRLEGKSKDHPVIYKMSNIKSLLEGLSNIDEKVTKLLQKHFNPKASAKKSKS